MDFQVEPAVITPIPEGFSAKLIGSIHTNTAWIEGEFKKVVAAKPKLVEVDLSETTFLSSMGIGVLVWLYNHVQETGGVVKIVAIRKRVLSSLKLSRLDSLFKTASARIVPD